MNAGVAYAIEDLSEDILKAITQAALTNAAATLVAAKFGILTEQEAITIAKRLWAEAGRRE